MGEAGFSRKLRTAARWFSLFERTRRRHVKELSALQARSQAAREDIRTIAAASDICASRVQDQRQNFKLVDQAVQTVQHDLDVIAETLKTIRVDGDTARSS